MKLITLTIVFICLNLQFGFAAVDSGAFVSKKHWNENVKKYDYRENFKEMKQKEYKGDSNIFSFLTKSWKIIVIIIIIVLVFILIYLLSGIYKNYKYRVSGNKILEPPVIENIETADLDSMLLQAINNRLFKDAIRYKYLILLKKLHGRRLINWKKDKTNGHYIREMANTTGFELFRYLTIKFEYFWYGEYNVEEKDYLTILPSFEKIDTLIFNREQ